MKRKKMVLLVLLGVLLLAVAHAWRSSPRQERVSDRPAVASRTPARQPAQAASRGGEGLEVRLDLLNRERGRYAGHRRDLFGPLYPPPPPPPPPVAPPVALPPPPPPPPPPLEEPRPELARFTFLGFLEKEAAKTVFLQRGEEVFVVRKGDRFGQSGQFLLADLSAEQLVIRQGSDPRPITIPLAEKGPPQPTQMRSTGRSGRTPAPPPFVPPGPPELYGPRPVDQIVDMAAPEPIEFNPNPLPVEEVPQ